MKVSLASTALCLSSLGALASAASLPKTVEQQKRWFPIAPKVMIISMFSPEALWPAALGLTQNITLPGLSPLFPAVNCNDDGSICHFTTGEGEINAACTASAVLLSPDFDLTSTYLQLIGVSFIAGIAGINPYMGTTGSVGLARFAVQVALAYEIDSRQIPSNWTTGYFLQGSTEPGKRAGNIYGTEVFELNTNLRDQVRGYLDGVTLNDTEAAAAFRANYDYAPANQPPQVFYGDVATSDVYFSGSLLDETFGNITQIWTNNTGVYALTAQEDNATFEAMVRAAKAGLMDFSRVVLMRTASDFDRAPANMGAVESFEAAQGGFTPAIKNILIAGTPIIEGILNDWDQVYANGVAPQDNWSFNADDFHTLAEQRKRGLRELRKRRII
ncbi:purine nucleoside permease [Papiliotrema laurentii]|uniref:Purine nucleoside permease n=1 Tax=Papiliotrema laurentii TaxID=5418 RepID=A0AAD9L7Z4_PAPLA|nr:purine nucleoside permease [Papiliotrema laurentii]